MHLNCVQNTGHFSGLNVLNGITTRITNSKNNNVRLYLCISLVVLPF